MSNSAEFYQRQSDLPELGLEGQARLAQSAVLVIGAGGLGCPVLVALAGAGVGKIGIVDADVIAASNLNRQFLYTVEAIGQNKADCAAARLRSYHPDLVFMSYVQRLDIQIASELFPQYDIIVACVDNLATRQVINSAAFSQHKTVIDGGIRGLSGYVTAVEPGKTPCLDCYFDLTARIEHQADGIRKPVSTLGATASVIGSLEAQLALLLILGQPNPVAGEILTYHGRTLTFERVRIEPNSNCKTCQPCEIRSPHDN